MMTLHNLHTTGILGYAYMQRAFYIPHFVMSKIHFAQTYVQYPQLVLGVIGSTRKMLCHCTKVQ